MNHGWTVIAAAGLSASLMYLLDPESGRRRRAVLRDRARQWSRRATESAQGTSRHLANRARGVVAETRSLVVGRHRNGGALHDVS